MYRLKALETTPPTQITILAVYIGLCQCSDLVWEQRVIKVVRADALITGPICVWRRRGGSLPRRQNPDVCNKKRTTCLRPSLGYAGRLSWRSMPDDSGGHIIHTCYLVTISILHFFGLQNMSFFPLLAGFRYCLEMPWSASCCAFGMSDKEVVDPERTHCMTVSLLMIFFSSL